MYEGSPARRTLCAEGRLVRRGSTRAVRSLFLVDRRERGFGSSRSRRRRVPLLVRTALDDDLELPVRGQACARRDESAHDDVLLETAQVVDLSGNRRLGEHLRRLLEGARADERLRRKARLRDAEQELFCHRRTTT